ncbi:MAG: hypothetical protein ABI276_05415, partial [Acidimicrobiales bacterium]
PWSQPPTFPQLPPTAPARAKKARGRSLLLLVAAIVTVVSLALAGVSFVRGNSWTNRSQKAEHNQADLNKKLDASESDAKALEGRLSTVSNMVAKNKDAQALIQSVSSAVSKLSDTASQLADKTQACETAIQQLQGAVGTDPTAPLDPNAVRAATNGVATSCNGLSAQVTDLQNAIDKIGSE